MKDIGKISVKHFLNKNIPIRNRSKNITSYPVYLKITFQRKSTEIKSMVFYLSETEKDFSNISQYKFDQEIAMIEYFVKKGFYEQGDSYTLKGISDTCKEYYSKDIRVLLQTYVLNDFDKFLHEQNDYFKHVILNRDKNTPVILYFLAANKLLTNKEDLLKFQDRFDVIFKMDFIDIPFYGCLTMQKLFDWQFGDLKVKFLKTAKSYEYTDNEISSIVNLIDNGISQLTS